MTPLGAIKLTTDHTHVLQARPLEKGTQCVHTSLWPEPLKYPTLPHPDVSIERLPDGQLPLLARAPAIAVWLEAAGVVTLTILAFDLLPDEPHTIHAVNLSGQPSSVSGRSACEQRGADCVCNYAPGCKCLPRLSETQRVRKGVLC